MEILKETNHIYEFWFFIIFVGVLTLVVLGLSIMFWYYLIAEKEFNFNSITPTLIFTLFGILLSWAFVTNVNHGANITYDVKVSDWNEVYDQGYEVVKQDGEIVTIQLKQ